MADKEKTTPEAEEVKAEEAAPAAEVETKEETATPETVEEPKKEEPKKEEPKKEEPKKAAKKGGKTGLIIGIVAAALVVVLLVLTVVMGTMATGAYKSGDYAKAYSNSKLALFLAKGDKNIIAQAYIEQVLCKEGKYFTAAEILEKTSLTEEEKGKIYASDAALALCKEGQVVKFGKYETDNNAANGPEDLEWIVLEVTKEGGRARALIMTKDVVGNPGGWNKFSDTNTFYSESNLNSWCEDFYASFTMYDASLKDKILLMKVSTADSSTGVDSGEDVEAYAYAPAKEDLDKYLTGDLAQYIKASPTDSAKAAGVTAYGKDKTAVYFLRNIGNKENDAQWAAGIDKEGAFQEGLSMSGTATGTRVCINVDLGEIK